MVHWGILGAGNIARRFAASLQQQPDSVLTAISCRSEEKARRFSDAVAVKKTYIGHDALLEDPQIDAIYLALPHGLHKEWAIKALRAGKAVLCEKPAALDTEEMRIIAQTAREQQVLFMEAMKPRFLPLYMELKARLASGLIGELTGVETSLCNSMPFEKMGKTYHTEPGQGGALLDCGCYCASWLEDLLSGNPLLMQIYASAKDGVDHYIDATLQFGAASARLECAFDRAKPRQAVLQGSKGSIVVEELHRPQRMTLYVDGQEPEIVTVPYKVDDFYGEIDHFTDCLQQGKTESDIMPLAVSIHCAEILDTIRAGLRCDERCLVVLRQQEDTLQYQTFGSTEALALGSAAAELAKEYDRGVGIAITRESDGLVLFQYMMDDKAPRNLGFMEAKRQAALASEHCSLWPYVEHQINGRWQELFENQPKVLPCGGAFPIRADGSWVATLTVSGLHEGKDHELVVRALSRILGKEVPAFPCMAI